MVRILFFLLITLTLHADTTFEQKCVECHNKLPVSFEKFYMRYLLFTSSNETAKEAMFYYLKEPKKETSVMPELMIEKLGVMPKLEISDSDLKKFIDIYVEKYDLRSKLH